MDERIPPPHAKVPWYRQPVPRRRFLAASAALAVGAGAYSISETEWLEVNERRIEAKIFGSSPLRILHLTDLHASSVVDQDFIESSVVRGIALKPDLVCLTGDYVTHKVRSFERYVGILKKASDAAPCFAVLGNHDGGIWSARRTRGYSQSTEVRKLLSRSGIELLHNRGVTQQVRGKTVALIGVGDYWSGDFNPTLAFSKPDAGSDWTIALSHNPDTKEELAPFAWDLLMCGHTHGGQLCLPLFGTPVAPVRDKRFVAGLFRWNQRWLHVCKGIGNLYGMRFNCRPEITLLTIT